MTPELSVVIPTYNRVGLLTEELEALLDQTLDRTHYEIVVVDDGSEDGTPDRLRELADRHPETVRWTQQSRVLAGAARNVGIAEARAPVVLLLDSDMLPNREFLAVHLELHRRHPERHVAVLGRVVTGKDAVHLCRPDDEEPEAVGSSAGGAPVVSVADFTTQNISLKKRFIAEAGGFTPGLPCLQDMDLAFRLGHGGMQLIYAARAAAEHRCPLDSVDKVIASGRKYGRTLAEWEERLRLTWKEKTQLGGRLDGGMSHFVEDPWQYVKDALRRWTINAFTIGWVEAGARRMPVTIPPKRLLVRFCKELWAYHYRHEYRLCKRTAKAG